MAEGTPSEELGLERTRTTSPVVAGEGVHTGGAAVTTTIASPLLSTAGATDDESGQETMTCCRVCCEVREIYSRA